MKTEFEKLESAAQAAESAARIAWDTLNARRARCQHKWQSRYNPLIREGYYDPGDPVGTMGIDRRLPMHVPREETPRWTRECIECGLEEHTQRANDEIKKVPVF